MQNGEEASTAINLIPCGDRVIVRRSEVAGKVGSIHIPDVAQERPFQGVVLAVGPGRLLESGARGDMPFVVGDQVIFGKFSGTELKHDEEGLVILREDEILAKVRSEQAPELDDVAKIAGRLRKDMEEIASTTTKRPQ